MREDDVMPKVTDEHRAGRRDQILSAATRCLTRRGIAATSVADIIQESGLSAGAIYLYFPSKHAILLAVAARVVTWRADEIAALGTLDPVPSPLATLHALAQSAREQSGIASGVFPRLILQFWGEATTDPELLEIAQDSFDSIRTATHTYLTGWARQQGHDADGAATWAAAYAPVMLSIFQGFFIQSTLDRTFDASAYLDRFAHVFAELDNPRGP